jgi:NitT/TauT family transport system substrate-binding protein
MCVLRRSSVLGLKAFVVIGIPLWCLVSQGCRRPSTSDQLRIAIATWPGFGVGFVGQEKGFFEKLRLDFVVMDDSAARHAAFQSRGIDIMISSADVFAQEVSQGIQGVAFLVTDESFGADGVVVRAEISRAEQLRGRRVAFARATPSHYLLYKILEGAALTPGDVKQVVVEDPGHAGQAFLGGSVDAAVTWEPLLSQVRNSGRGRVLTTTRDYPGTIVDLLIASQRLSKQTDILRRFVAGWLRAVDYVLAHPNESSTIIGRGLKVPEAEVRAAMGGLRYAGVGRNRSLLCPEVSGSPAPVMQILRDAAAFWKSQGVLSSPPSFDDSVSTLVCEDVPHRSSAM